MKRSQLKKSSAQNDVITDQVKFRITK